MEDEYEDEYIKMKKQRTPGTYEWYLVHDLDKAIKLALEQRTELSKEKAVEPDIPREYVTEDREQFVFESVTEGLEEDIEETDMIKLYQDKELKEEVPVNEAGQLPPIEFGAVEAGETATKKLYVHNPTEGTVRNLKVELVEDSKTVIGGSIIINCPSELKKGEIREIEIKYIPVKESKRGLRAKICISGEILYAHD